MTDNAGCNCKVSRARDRYDIDADDATLVADWQDGTSVRSLTRTFNEALIDARLESVDGSTVVWNRLPVYEAVRTEDLDQSDVIEVRRELERVEVDPDELESDLISHQTMYRHLTSCLDATASTDATPEDRREKARNTVYALQRRTTIVTESTMETLQSVGVTAIGDPDVLVDVQIICRECGQSMDFETALADGCNCD